MISFDIVSLRSQIPTGTGCYRIHQSSTEIRSGQEVHKSEFILIRNGKKGNQTDFKFVFVFGVLGFEANSNPNVKRTKKKVL